MVYEFGDLSVERLVTGRWKENCYLIKDRESEEVAIIDPGDDADIIAGKLQIGGGRLRCILLTHGHYDHVGGASQICETNGLPCLVHKDDIPLLRRASLYAMAFENATMEVPRNVSAFPPDQPLKLGRHTIETIPTPGHTPGSVCFDFGPFMLSGDTLLEGKIGRADLPGGNIEQLNDSVEDLFSKFFEDAVIFPGHGNPWDTRRAREWRDQVREVN
jgi:hydroxyacylglutathione hydrolase